MNHTKRHSNHMFVIVAVGAGAMLMGFGTGWAFAIALLGCGAMLLGIVLLLRSDRLTNSIGDRDAAVSDWHDSHNV